MHINQQMVEYHGTILGLENLRMEAYSFSQPYVHHHAVLFLLITIKFFFANDGGFFTTNGGTNIYQRKMIIMYNNFIVLHFILQRQTNMF